MRLEIATSEERLRELEPAWWALWRSAARTTPFQSPAWLIPWIRSFARDWQLRVIAVHSDSGLEALLPLGEFVWRGALRVAALGVGVSDYADVLVRPRSDGQALKAVQHGLELVSRSVELMELEDVPAASPLCDVARTYRGATLAPHAQCAVVVLASELADYFRSLPKPLRRSLRRARRELERTGRFAWRRADERNLDAMLECLFELHAARWRARGESGVLADPEVQQFHRQAAPRLLRAGLLGLFVLEIAGAPAGAVYVLYGPDAYFYLGGFLPEFEDLSVGNLLIEHALTDAHRAGKRRCDFLRGSERYKYLWGARDESTQRISIPGGLS